MAANQPNRNYCINRNSKVNVCLANICSTICQDNYDFVALQEISNTDNTQVDLLLEMMKKHHPHWLNQHGCIATGVRLGGQVIFYDKAKYEKLPSEYDKKIFNNGGVHKGRSSTLAGFRQIASNSPKKIIAFASSHFPHDHQDVVLASIIHELQTTFPLHDEMIIAGDFNQSLQSTQQHFQQIQSSSTKKEFFDNSHIQYNTCCFEEDSLSTNGSFDQVHHTTGLGDRATYEVIPTFGRHIGPRDGKMYGSDHQPVVATIRTS